MGAKGTRRIFLSTWHPNTILKPNPDPITHPNPSPTPTPAPTPTPNPSSRGNVSAPGARRASFVTRALPVDCCR